MYYILWNISFRFCFELIPVNIIQKEVTKFNRLFLAFRSPNFDNDTKNPIAKNRLVFLALCSPVTCSISILNKAGSCQSDTAYSRWKASKASINLQDAHHLTPQFFTNTPLTSNHYLNQSFRELFSCLAAPMQSRRFWLSRTRYIIALL